MILVSGATGLLGGRITKRILGTGKDVRILVRRDSPSSQMASQGMATDPISLISSGAIPEYGDLKDKASLKKCCKGVEIVVTTANAAMRSGKDTIDTVDRLGNQNLIEAAVDAGVRQFIFVSFLGATLDHPVPLFKAKAETEAYLRSSGLRYTILAPNFFIESWAGMVIGIPLQSHNPVTLVGEGKKRHSLISIEDVAAFTVAAIDHPAGINQRVFLGGPEAISWIQVLDAFSQITGFQIPVQFVKPGDPIPGLPEIVPPMLAAMETYESIIPMEETSATFGVSQTSLIDTVTRMLISSGS